MRRATSLVRVTSSVLCALMACIWFVPAAKSDVNKDRKNAAKNLGKEIEQAQFHRVYVPDFLDPSGGRTEKGCFFASTFSSNLAKDAHGFEVVNRIQAQKKLNELHISPQDFQKPEVLSKAAQALGADAFLMGTAAISAKEAKLSLSLRDTASGKEVRSTEYHEKLEPQFEASFPAEQSQGIYYFPGLDGVSDPKCAYCPNPDYTNKARGANFQGSVLLSMVIDEQGAVREVRVVQDPGYGLGQKSIDSLKKWRLAPSRDPQGSPVIVRVKVETVFRLL